MPANLSINPELESDLCHVVPLRMVAEWHGLSAQLHTDYCDYIKSLAEMLTDDPTTVAWSMWPSETVILEWFGRAYSAYVELVRRDVVAYLSNGTIPMTSMAQWGDI